MFAAAWLATYYSPVVIKRLQQLQPPQATALQVGILPPADRRDADSPKLLRSAGLLLQILSQDELWALEPATVKLAQAWLIEYKSMSNAASQQLGAAAVILLKFESQDEYRPIPTELKQQITSWLDEYLQRKKGE